MQAHVSKILESFCATLETLERYVRNPPLHWTDTENKNAAEVRLPEPELLIQTLRNAINDITTAFGPYLDEMLPQDVKRKLPVV